MTIVIIIFALYLRSFGGARTIGLLFVKYNSSMYFGETGITKRSLVR